MNKKILLLVCLLVLASGVVGAEETNTDAGGTPAKTVEPMNFESSGSVTIGGKSIEYTATVDARGMPASPGTLGDDCFVVVEKWASLAALQAHAVAPHMKAYAARVKELMAKRVIHVLEPAEAG